MQLDKKDLEQIKTIVGEIVQKSETRLNKKIEDAVEKSEKKVMQTIESSEKRVITIINREVSDLAEINRVVIDKVDRIDILEKRLTRVEHKVGISG